MEVLNAMSMPVQSSQVQNGTGLADESESLRTGPVQSAPFSRVFNQRVKGGDKKENSTDSSTNDHLSTREVASMKQHRLSQQQLQFEQQQRVDWENSTVNETTSLMPNSQDGINDKSGAALPSDESLESANISQTNGDLNPLYGTALLNLQWAQVVIPANTSSNKDTDWPLSKSADQSGIKTVGLTVPDFGAIAKGGFVAVAQGDLSIEQQAAVLQGKKAGTLNLDGNSSANLTPVLKENGGDIQESACQRQPSLKSEMRLNRLCPGELADSDVGVIVSNGNALQQGSRSEQANPETASQVAEGSSPQSGELRKSDIISLVGSDTGKSSHGAVISTINIETMVGDNEPNVSRIFARGAIGKAGGLVSPTAIDGRPSGEAKIKSQTSGIQLQESSNGLETKSDTIGIETQQTPQTIDEEAKTVIKEESGTQSKIIEERPANNNPALFVHGQNEAKTREESGLSNSANNGKLPSTEQIYHQVREKLESGDYGINKSNITLKLHPEELGELKINLRMEEQRLKVDIVTDNRSVKEALMQNLDTLKDTLSRQNISMERFNVSADIRHGFQQESGGENRMMQNNRVSNTHVQTKATVENSAQPILNYGWESDSSLVSLVL